MITNRMESSTTALLIRRRLCIAEAVARAALQPETAVFLSHEFRDNSVGRAVTSVLSVGATLDRLHVQDDDLCLRVSKLHIKRLSSSSLRLLLISGVATDVDLPIAYRVDFARAAEADAWLRLLHRMQRVAVLREELVLALMDASSSMPSPQALRPTDERKTFEQPVSGMTVHVPASSMAVLSGRPETASCLCWDGAVQCWKRTLPYSDVELVVDRVGLVYGPPKACYPLTADDVGCMIAATLDSGATVRASSIVTIDDALRSDVEAVLARGSWRLPREWVQLGSDYRRRSKSSSLTLSMQGVQPAGHECRCWHEHLQIEMDSRDPLRLTIRERHPTSAEDMQTYTAAELAAIQTPDPHQRDQILLVFRAMRALALMGYAQYQPESAETGNVSGWICGLRLCFGKRIGPRHARPEASASKANGILNAVSGSDPPVVLAPSTDAVADTSVVERGQTSMIVLAPNGDVSVIEHGGHVSTSRAACTSVVIEPCVLDTSIVAFGQPIPTGHAQCSGAAFFEYDDHDIEAEASNHALDVERWTLVSAGQRTPPKLLSGPKPVIARPDPNGLPLRAWTGHRPVLHATNVHEALASEAGLEVTPHDADQVRRQQVWKRLHWNCVPRHQIPGSVWAEIHSQRWVPDLVEMISLFSNDAATFVAGARAAQGLSASDRRTFAILDAKHARNLDILLGKFKHLTSDLLVDAFHRGDLEALDQDFLCILLPMLPRAAEQVRIQEACKANEIASKEKLIRPERFMLSLILGVPRVAAKVNAVGTMRQFSDSLSSLLTAATTITSSCRELRCSQRFRTILELLLTIGNTLNEGTVRAHAAGFTFDSIPLLVQSRSVLSYASAVLQQSGGLATADLELGIELPSIQGASRIELDGISTGFSELEHDLQDLEAESEQCANEETGRALAERFRAWLEPARAQLDEFRQTIRLMNEAVEDTLLFLPMDDRTKRAYTTICFGMLGHLWTLGTGVSARKTPREKSGEAVGVSSRALNWTKSRRRMFFLWMAAAIRCVANSYVANDAFGGHARTRFDVKGAATATATASASASTLCPISATDLLSAARLFAPARLECLV
ncbi:hypothetical protein F1559_004293 [Cyanidiococcus yangmingshanensis]|uniref:FH2 domain-containing protein n=1 Tax=Cyanidiococcus yangmingshanensis TaxID=2690220 RepID=A0A7J7IJG9_9RHOD|nr:hypothetical protein F1559_004293 [Cyanidiococcus yangmingshanensis]